MSDAVQDEDQDLGAWGWVRSIVSWLVLLLLLAILMLTIVIPRLTGSTPYTVLTGSMRPTYPPGTLIVVKPHDPATLGVGDAITFQKESGDPEVVTHRIIESRRNSKGETTFVTQGDANPSRDKNPVVAEQIRGKVWYSVPYLGYVNTVITGKQRAVVIALVAGGLLVYAVSMFVGALRDRTRRKTSPTVTADVPVDDAPTSPLARVRSPDRHQMYDADTTVIPRIEGGGRPY